MRRVTVPPPDTTRRHTNLFDHSPHSQEWLSSEIVFLHQDRPHNPDKSSENTQTKGCRGTPTLALARATTTQKRFKRNHTEKNHNIFMPKMLQHRKALERYTLLRAFRTSLKTTTHMSSTLWTIIFTQNKIFTARKKPKATHTGSKSHTSTTIRPPPEADEVIQLGRCRLV